MSETVQYTGKLTEIDLKGLTVEKKAEEIFEKLGGVENLYSSFADWLLYEMDKEYYVDGEKLYEISDFKNIDSDDDIFQAKKQTDGSIDFNVRFYNGGCCLDEALEVALANMEDTTHGN